MLNYTPKKVKQPPTIKENWEKVMAELTNEEQKKVWEQFEPSNAQNIVSLRSLRRSLQ